MKLGEKITIKNFEYVLIGGTNCTQCCFNYEGINCSNEGLLRLCLAQTGNDDDGVFTESKEDK